MRCAVNRRGVTLVECAVALAAGGALLAALHGLLLATGRARALQSARLEVRRATRTVAAALRAELQLVSAGAGDLLAVSDTALTLRASRGLALACGGSGGRVVVQADVFTGVRAPDPTRDGVRLWTDAGAWYTGSLTSTGAAPCGDGSPGLALDVVPPPAASVPVGAPVLLTEIVEYRLYADGEGVRWFGVRGRTGSGWSATSPIAGPLRERDGLQIALLDARGQGTGRPDSAALVAVRVRARAAGVVHAGGGRLVAAEDSLRFSVAVP